MLKVSASSCTSSFVVIPAYQPSEMLPDLVKKVVATGYGVIVVDDGSAPDKQWIFEQLNNLTGVVVLHHVENTGKGAALKTAFAYIRKLEDATIYIVTMDADGQHLPEDMERTIMAARLHPGSLVLGVRNFDKDIPLRSKLGNKITRTVFRLFCQRDMLYTILKIAVKCINQTFGTCQCLKCDRINKIGRILRH